VQEPEKKRKTVNMKEGEFYNDCVPLCHGIITWLAVATWAPQT